MSTGAPHRRTLWEEGRHPGRLVCAASAVGLLAVALLDLLLFGHLTLFFDVCFVAACMAAALTVRPRDFFVVGVLPPLLLAAIVLVLAVLHRGAVAQPDDVVLQALVSGLAHHSGALVVGYGLTLGLLAVRQVAARHAGTIRGGRPARRPADAPGADAAEAVGPDATADLGEATYPLPAQHPIPEQRLPPAQLRR